MFEAGTKAQKKAAETQEQLELLASLDYIYRQASSRGMWREQLGLAVRLSEWS